MRSGTSKTKDCAAKSLLTNTDTKGRSAERTVVAGKQQAVDVLRTEHLSADLRGRSVRGGFWTVSSQGAQFIIQSVSTIVLARLLTPADFGLVAMVAAVTVLGQAFADLGLSEATIQSEVINHDQVSTLFWINVAIGIGLMLLTMALAPLLVWFYGEPRLKEITIVMSLTFLIGGLRVQHTALLQRQMQFKSLAFRDAVSAVLGVTVAIVLALRGAGYWAIISLPLAFNFTQMTLSWILVGWIPGPPKRNAKVRSLIVFGSNVAGSYLLGNITGNADSVLIGWYWGAGPLGLYSRAFNLLMLPVRQLSGPIGMVALPTLSRLHDDPDRLARYYLRLLNLITWLAAPIFGFLFVAAEPVIILVLGRRWLEAAPIFQILAIQALAQLVVITSMWLLSSQGHSARLLKLLLITSPIMVASFAIGLRFGVRGVALAGSLAQVALIPFALKFSFHGTALTLRRFGRSILCPISVSLASVSVALLGLHVFAPRYLFSQLLVSFLGFAVIHATSVAIRPLRKEMMAIRELFGELRLTA